jgi:hypothetical protein
MDVLLTDLVAHLQDRGVADITDGLLDFCLCLFLSNKFNKFLALLTVK